MCDCAKFEKCICDTLGCRCVGNTECRVCYAAMRAAFYKQCQDLKDLGMEALVPEAKEFMWDFYANRDKMNIEAIQDELGQAEIEGDPNKWIP